MGGNNAHVAHLQWHFYLGLHVHDGMVVPPGLPSKLPHVAVDVLNGLFLNSKPSNDIWHGGDPEIEPNYGWAGMPFMGRMTDAGFIVPHLSFPMNNPMIILTILFGSSISLLGSSSTKVSVYNPVPLFGGKGETPMAAVLFGPVPLSLNLACWDPIPLPTDLVVAPDNVFVGISAADWWTALIDFAIEVLLAVVLAGLGSLGSSSKKGASAGGEAAAKQTTGEVMDEAAEKSMKKGLKNAGMPMATGAGQKAAKESMEEAGEKAAKEAGQEATENSYKLGVDDAIKKYGDEDSIPLPARQKILGDSLQAGEDASAQVRREAADRMKQGWKNYYGARWRHAGWEATKSLGTSFGGTVGKSLGREQLYRLFPSGTREPSCDVTSTDVDGTGVGFSHASPVRVRVEFSESVEGFAHSDVTLTGATMSASSWTPSADKKSYEFDITPGGPGSVTVNVHAGVCHYHYDVGDWHAEKFGEHIIKYPNTAGFLTFSWNSERPTVDLGSTVAPATRTEPIPVTVHFSKAVQDFTASDVQVSGGTIRNFGGSAKDYSFEIANPPEGDVRIDVAENVAQDAWGNQNHAASQLRIKYDTTGPEVSKIVAPSTTGKDPFRVSVHFDEDVQGFGSGSVDVQGGTASNFSGSGHLYHFDVHPAQAGPVDITIQPGRVTDLAGNPNTSAALHQTYYDPSNVTNYPNLTPNDQAAIAAGQAIMNP